MTAPGDRIAIETKIVEILGKYPGHGDRYFDAFKHLTNIHGQEEPNQLNNRLTNLRVLLKDWLIAKGVSEVKVRDSSDFVLNNAYRAGNPYINKMIQDDGGRGRRRSPHGGGFEHVDIDLLNDGIPPAPKPNDQQIRHPVDEKQVLVTEDAIARVADAVIAPRIAEAQRQLERSIKQRSDSDRAVLEAMISKGLQDLHSSVSNMVETIAKDVLQRMIPQKLQIIDQNNKLLRELDAEPRHECFEECLKWLQAEHIYLVGPKGTGKTHLGEQLSKALGLTFFPIDQSLTKYDVKGYKGPTGEYVATLVRLCVEEGGLLMIDEGDMWAAAALGALNSILANQWGAFPDKLVKVHPDFRCVLAANTYGTGATREYEGRNPLDAASLDRFIFIPIDYDMNLERQIYGPSNWLEYVWKVRAACNQTKQEKMAPSMRAIKKGMHGYKVHLDPDTICNRVLWKGAAPDTIHKIKAIAGEPPKTLYNRPIREVA